MQEFRALADSFHRGEWSFHRGDWGSIRGDFMGNLWWTTWLRSRILLLLSSPCYYSSAYH